MKKLIICCYNETHYREYIKKEDLDPNNCRKATDADMLDYIAREKSTKEWEILWLIDASSLSTKEVADWTITIDYYSKAGFEVIYDC